MILQTVLLALTFSYGAAQESDYAYEQYEQQPVCDVAQSPVTRMVNSLGFRLEKMIDTEENYIFSPLSISVALAMVYIGARGTTREEMAEALEYNVIGKNCLPNKISESFRALIRSLQNEGEGYSFLIANGAFLQKGKKISHYYSSSLEKYFNSNMKYVDFAKEDVAAMNQINEWVANYTRGKIPRLLVEPLDHWTIMVLLNAVYFKGLWDVEFDENVTRHGIFHRINNPAKSVSFMMMTHDNIPNYYDPDRQYSIIELDYKGNNISMIVLLPRDISAFPRYELTSELLCDIRNNFQYSTVTVMLPKFSLEFKRELSKDMITMGMGELFSDRADLTGIRERNDLHVSQMLHKAVIEVNEKGSEAASIVGISIDGRKKISQREIFLADHPFLFYIIHKHTNTILFSGRMLDP